MSAALPGLVQASGVPFDVFIQALTEQLDKAQATMALKARVAKLPLTFAVKDVALDLRAFVQFIDDDIYIRPATPGDTEASTVRLALTTITRTMVEENAVDFKPEDPKFSLREVMRDHLSEGEQRQLERIGVQTVSQLTELRKTAGADVVARLARMPINRLQQALLAAAAPRVTQVEKAPALRGNAAARVHVDAPLMRSDRLPLIRAAGEPVPLVSAANGKLVLAPHAFQLGAQAEVDFGSGDVAHVQLTEGSIGQWKKRVPVDREIA